MRIIISPAKKMKVDSDSLPYLGLPQFLPQAEIIKKYLQQMDSFQLQALWKCNDTIAAQNIEQLKSMDLQHNLSPAILSYQGIQYQYMAPGVFEYDHLNYIQEHLRIVSGFYGLLRPFDGVVPYRLEMQAKLSVSGEKSLYSFWGNQLAEQLRSETNLILNLASKEYSKAIIPYLPSNVRLITCIFGERIGSKILEKGTMCKMARGQMVRFLAEHKITSAESIKTFNQLGYTYSENDSTSNCFVFVKGDSHHVE